MKRRQTVWLIILVSIFVIFNIGGYVLLTKKLIHTKTELKETRFELYSAIKESQILQDELKLSQDKLKLTNEELQQVKFNLENTQKELNIVKTRLTKIEECNLVLLEEKEKLDARLHSLKELKAAIREVKLESRQQRLRQCLLKIKTQREIDAQKLTQGNRGYLVKDGQSLYHLTKIKIEVKPVY